jgi:hypothetical protein
LTVLVTPLAIAALSGHAQRPKDIDAYRVVIDGYRSGAQGAETDLAWLRDVHATIEHAADQTNGWRPIDLTAAAMMHTDVALRLVKAARGSDATTHIVAACTLPRAAVDRAPEP